MPESSIKLPAWVQVRKSLLSQEKIDRLLSIKPEEVNKPLLLELFSRRATKLDNGTYKVDEPYMHPTQEFILPANTLVNQPTTQLTTAGLYIYNMHIIAPCFGEMIPYINEPVNSKVNERVLKTIASALLNKKISTKNYKLYNNRLTRLASCCGFLMDGLSEDLITPNPVVEKAKRELFEKYKDEIKKNNSTLYVDKIENKLLEIAENELKMSPNYTLYQKGGKPSFSNNYKNNMLTVGPLMDPITGKYIIATNSYDEGVNLESFAVACNKAIYASYNRGVKTQDGGAMTKYLYALMHSIQSGKTGSDCRSTKYRDVLLTKKNVDKYLYRYIWTGKVKDGRHELLELTDDNINDYIGKVIKLRSPMYCKTPGNTICSVCLGSMFERMGLKNIGLTTTTPSSVIMNKSMKAMHDISVKLADIDLYKYIKKVKD